MRATVANNHGFTGAVTVAVVNRAECDSKKSLKENYCTVADVSKLGSNRVTVIYWFQGAKRAP